METKWTSGFLRDTAPKMSASYLASSTTILSNALVRSLANDLQLNQEQLARELGYLPQCFGTDGLYHWCKSPGSTIFVLVSVLSNLGRTDCVHRIEHYLQMHSMQLFIKVEEATKQGPPYATSPKFYQVTTSCEFSLVQALENILGGDLVHYEIIGPGSWVTWTTLAQELKGQQLTLLYHNQPVPHTRAALYGSSETGIKINQPVIKQNIPVNIEMTPDDETDLKVFEHTQIESLKYVLDSSVPATNSNNMTSCDSLNFEFSQADRITKATIFPSLDSQSSHMLTMDSQTQIKIPIACKNNTPECNQVVKVFPNKDIDSMSNDDITIEQDPLHVLNNVPHLSIKEQNESMISSNEQRITLQTAQNSILRTTQNPQIPTTQTMTSQSTQNTMTSQSAQNTPLRSECTQNQNKLNNLNSGTMASSPHPSYVPNSLDSHIVQKSTDILTYTVVARPSSRPLQVETAVDNVMHVDHSKKQFSEVEMDTFDTGLAASSLFTQARQAQQINVSTFSQSVDYVPHACIQNVDAQLQNVDWEAPSLQSQSPGIVITPPQERHRFFGVTTSPLTSPEQQVQQQLLQQQAFLETKLLELKQLQQLQQVQTLTEIAASSSGHISAVNHQNYQHQLQSFLLNVPQTSKHQHHQDAYHKQSSSAELVQNSSHQPWDKKPQSFPLPCFSHQQFQHPAQPQPHHQSHCDTQATDKQFFVSHTLPQQFPVEIAEKNCHPLSEFQQRQFRESQLINTSFNQQGNAVVQSKEQTSHMMNVNVRGEQYVTVLKPQSIGLGHSSSIPLFNRSQRSDSLGPSTHARLPNFELTVRLPQPNIDPCKQQIILNPRNRPRSSSDVSSFGNSAGSGTTFANSGVTFANSGVTLANSGATFLNSGATPHNSGGTPHNSGGTFHNSGGTFHNSGGTPHNSGGTFHNSGGTPHNSGGTPHNSGATPHYSDVTFANSGLILMQRGEQSPMMNVAAQHTTQPITVPQFSHTGTSMTNSSGASRKEGMNEDITIDEEGYNYIDNGHPQRSNSHPVNQWPSPATPKRAGLSLETELLHIEGWCPQENGDTIQSTMEMYRSQDGSFILWKSRRYNKFVITVSHLNKLFYFRVEEAKHENRERIVYYLFEGGFRSESLLDLLQHYRQNSIKISVQSPSGTKTYIEHIKLRYPIKSMLMRKDASRPS